MNTRIEMAKLGWNSEDRLSDMGWAGGTGYTVWFERWNWHGRLIDRVSYSASALPGPEGCPSAQDIQDAVERAANLAKQAWAEYTEPGCAPRVSSAGKLIADPFRWEIVRGYVPDKAAVRLLEYDERTAEVIGHVQNSILIYFDQYRGVQPTTIFMFGEKPPVGSLIRVQRLNTGEWKVKETSNG